MSKCADYVFLFVRPSQLRPRAASEVTQVSTAAVSAVTEEGSSITGGGERLRARRAVRRPRGRKSRTAAMATEDPSNSTKTARATCPMNSFSFTTPTRGDTTPPPGVHTAAHFAFKHLHLHKSISLFHIIICIHLAWIPHLNFGAIYRVGKKGCVFTQPT